jgi:hypothetical protein
MDLFNTTYNRLERLVVNADHVLALVARHWHGWSISRDPAAPDHCPVGEEAPSGGRSRQTARAA